MSLPRGLVGACETAKKESHEPRACPCPLNRDRVVIIVHYPGHYPRLPLNLLAVLRLGHTRQSQPGQEDGT
jgi:hypothetical protein